jgi:arylformamidase
MDHWRLSATEYRARFDAAVTFSNGGGLRADGFRVDVPGPDVTEQDVASLFIASLNLLMVDSVELHDLSVFAEPHKGTRGGPGDRPAPGSLPGRIVDLTHPIRDGLITFPGLPAPQIRPHLTRAQSRSRYEPGTEFQIDAITMVGNTGTYLDSPFHRYADGQDLPAPFAARPHSRDLYPDDRAQAWLSADRSPSRSESHSRRWLVRASAKRNTIWPGAVQPN